MRFRRSWLVLGLLAALSAPLLVRAAVVYKWVDADGVVHFSDQPAPGAEKMTTSGLPTRGILNQPPPPSGPSGQTPPKASILATMHLSITSPAPDQTFSGAEVVEPVLAVEPELQPGAGLVVSWTLNGAPVPEGDGTTHFSLPDLPRGTYTIAATITDTSTGTSKSADPVTFNVIRPSVLAPQHK